MKEINDLIQLCLNDIHGKDSFLYRDLGKERIIELAQSLIDKEHEASTRAINRFKLLKKEDQLQLMEKLKNIISEMKK